MAILKILLSKQKRYKMDIEVFNGVVSMNDIQENNTYPLLIIVNNRLGEREIPERCYSHIFKLLQQKSFIGMIGGVGGEAMYIVGYHEDNLIPFDPHYVQS